MKTMQKDTTDFTDEYCILRAYSVQSKLFLLTIADRVVTIPVSYTLLRKLYPPQHGWTDAEKAAGGDVHRHHNGALVAGGTVRLVTTTRLLFPGRFTQPRVHLSPFLRLTG